MGSNSALNGEIFCFDLCYFPSLPVFSNVYSQGTRVHSLSTQVKAEVRSHRGSQLYFHITRYVFFLNIKLLL